MMGSGGGPQGTVPDITAGPREPGPPSPAPTGFDARVITMHGRYEIIQLLNRELLKEVLKRRRDRGTSEEEGNAGRSGSARGG